MYCGKKTLFYWIILAILVPLLLPGLSFSEEGVRSEADIARQLQNPLSNYDLLGLSSRIGHGQTPNLYSLNQNGLKVQGMAPFSVAPGWGMVAQSGRPGAWKNTGRALGIRDLSVSALVTPVDVPTITWGLGPALSFSSPNNSPRNERWTPGASGAVVYSVKAWVGGVFISNMWSFEGHSNRSSAKQTIIQPFLNYNLSKGWYLTSTPALTFDWKNQSGNAWTVPVGGGVGKVVSLYGQVINIATQGYLYPVHADNEPGWAVQTTLQWLFPK